MAKLTEKSELAKNYQFDIALSFAGEDREYVDRVANLLRDQGVKVFYDLFVQVDLWGRNLYEHLSATYQDQARFTVMFISSHYASKLWTNHERKAAQARAFQEAQEYILPARFDDTEIPGVLRTVGYISLAGMTPETLASLITKKLVGAGISVPSDLVRRNYSSVSALPRPEPSTLKVTISDDEGKGVGGATVTALAENGTVLNATSDIDGSATLSVQTRKNYRLLVAHPNYPATIIEEVDPADNIAVVVPRSENLGSLIVHSTGYIDGLEGRLNPILDTSNRTYLYADNIAINGGLQQPATVVVDEPFELEDCHGTVFIVSVKLIFGRTTLLQYLRPSVLEN
jgi:hypothetical protein